MAEHPKAALIRNVYDAFARGDMETLTSLYDADVVYHMPGNNPLSGQYRGRDAVFGLYGRLPELLAGGTFRIELHDVLANDEHAVALTRQYGSRQGKQLDGVLECHVFHVSNGKVTEIWANFHDQRAFDEFWS